MQRMQITRVHYPKYFIPQCKYALTWLSISNVTNEQETMSDVGFFFVCVGFLGQSFITLDELWKILTF